MGGERITTILHLIFGIVAILLGIGTIYTGRKSELLALMYLYYILGIALILNGFAAIAPESIIVRIDEMVNAIGAFLHTKLW